MCMVIKWISALCSERPERLSVLPYQEIVSETIDQEEHAITRVNKTWESPPKLDVFLLLIERVIGSENGREGVGWAHSKDKFSLLVFDFIGVLTIQGHFFIGEVLS